MFFLFSFCLYRCTEPTLTESEQQTLESERVDRSLFVQEFILSTLSESLPPREDWEALSGKLGQLAQNSEASPPDNDRNIEASSSSLVEHATPSNSPLTNEACGENNKEGVTPGNQPPSQTLTAATLNNNLTPAATGHLPTQQHQNLVQNIRPQVSSTSQQNHNSSGSASSSNPSGGGRSGSRKSSSSSNSRGRSSNGAFAQINQVNQMGVPQSQQQPGGGGARSGGNSTMGAGGATRGANRDGLHLGGGIGRGVFRNNAVGSGGNNGAGGTSPSSTRRKVPRGGQVDDRNKSSEPPPPH